MCDFAKSFTFVDEDEEADEDHDEIKEMDWKRSRAQSGWNLFN